MKKPRKPLTDDQKKEASLRAQEWVKLHPERAKEYRRKYYQKNKVKMKAHSDEYRNKDLKAHNQRVATYRADKPWYGSWISAKYRCTNPNANSYHRYGGRGIKFFLTKEDMKWLWERDHASALDYPSIDRIDVDGDYTLENCQFIEHRENCRRESGYSKVKNVMERIGRRSI